MDLTETLEHVASAIVHGRNLGLDVDSAEATIADAETRLGLTGEIYAVALVGGTGVGKSSVLNTLAGREVSPASVIRPTTATPSAWIHVDASESTKPLLDWLGVAETLTHTHDDLRSVVVVDFPDIDSVATEHRARVDEALPRLDSVTWVVDPEKYDDERLHLYLRAHTFDRGKLRVVLNKSDLIDREAAKQLIADLRRRLDPYVDEPRGLELHVVSAATGDGVDDLASAIKADDDAKGIIVSAIRNRAVSSVQLMTEQLRHPGKPLDEGMEAYAAEAAAAATDLIDPLGLALQVKTAYRERARDLAGSLLGRTMGLIGMITGRRSKQANPGRFVKAWRERGDLARATLPIRRAYVEASESLGPTSQMALMSRLNPEWVRTKLAEALDATASATALETKIRTPGSWRVLATMQWVATVAFLLSLVWIALLIFGPGDLPVGEIEVPILGPLPTPIVVLASALLASVLLAWLAGIHSSVIGARAGRRLRKTALSALDERIEGDLFQPLRDLETARQGLLGDADSLGIDVK